MKAPGPASPCPKICDVYKKIILKKVQWNVWRPRFEHHQRSTRGRERERNVLFNDALNTLRLYDVRHMIKDHSDSEKGNPLPPHRLLFPISSKGSFLYAPSHRQDSTYHGLCYTSRGALAGMRNSSMARGR